MSIPDDAEDKMQAAIAHLQEELKKIRTGVANPAMVEDVSVDVYGTQMRLRELASITSPETRQILITPYDANNASSIGKAIEKANLGFQPIVEGNAVRINIPPMDEALRSEMGKLCHKKQEEAKISIRSIRKDANDEVKKQKADGEITEDDQSRLEKEIQNLTDKYCKQAEELSSQKEKEVLTI